MEGWILFMVYIMVAVVFWVRRTQAAFLGLMLFADIRPILY